MPESDNKPKRRPLKKLPPENIFSKAWLVWIAITGAVAVLLFVKPDSFQSARITLGIPKVAELAAQGKVTRGEIRRDGNSQNVTIQGELREAIPAPGSVPSTRFIATGWLRDENLKDLQTSGVFTELPATTLLTAVLTQLIPFVVVIALLYFLFVR